jgi:hypothetical protein
MKCSCYCLENLYTYGVIQINKKKYVLEHPIQNGSYFEIAYCPVCGKKLKMSGKVPLRLPIVGRKK